MKMHASIMVIVMFALFVSLSCLGEDYSRGKGQYLGMEKKQTDFYSGDEEDEPDYVFEEFSLGSEQDDYSTEGEIDSFIDSYMDPSLGGYGYLSGDYEITEYGQPSEDFYYHRDPEIPSPPTPPNILYQIMRRSRDK